MREPSASNGEANGKVLVRLSDVHRDLRMRVADEIIRRGKLRGFDAAAMSLAAFAPLENPRIVVSAEKAERVLRERKVPLGKTPEVWRY